MNKTINAEWTRRHFFAGLTAAGVAGGLAWNGETAWLQQAVDERPVSGFLGDYSKLIPVPNNGDLLFYEKEPVGSCSHWHYARMVSYPEVGPKRGSRRSVVMSANRTFGPE